MRLSEETGNKSAIGHSGTVIYCARSIHDSNHLSSAIGYITAMLTN